MDLDSRAFVKAEGIEVLESRIAPAVIYVTTLSDHETAGKTTLRDAITQADASPGSTIDFGSAAHALKGTVTLTSPLPAITDSVTINGTGVVINGAGKFQGLSVTSGATTVSITGLEITKGNSVTNGNTGTYGGTAIGGGLYVNDSGGTVTLTNCVITGNHAVGAKGAGAAGYAAEGGGIAILNGAVVLQGSTVSGNSAVGGAGGAGGSPYGYSGGNAYGGGIFNAGTLTLESLAIQKGTKTTQQSSKISGNSAVGGNGGVAINYSNATAAGAVPGTAGGSGGNAYGGGIANVGGTVTSQELVVNHLVVQQSVISGNAAKGGVGQMGGKTYAGANGTNFSVYAGSVYAPTSGYAGGNGYGGGSGGKGVGGGISNSSGGTLTVVASTISGNTATGAVGGTGAAGGHGGNGGHGGSYQGTSYPAGYLGYGGSGGSGGNGGRAAGAGIYSNGLLTVQVSTISGNSALSGKAGPGGVAGKSGTGAAGGGGTVGAAGKNGSLFVSRGGGIDSEQSTIALSLVTVAKNTAFNGGGASIYQDDEASIHNTTIAFNTAAATGKGGGLFVIPDTGNDPVNVVSTIIAKNTGQTGPDVSGPITAGFTLILNASGATVTDDASSDPNYLSPSTVHLTYVGSSLGTHDHGPMQTLLATVDTPFVTNNIQSNPDVLSADENGTAFGASIYIGAVDSKS